MDSSNTLWERRPGLCVAGAIGALLILRAVIVILSPIELGPDEAQYWRWAQTLDWGYYSKPPLIAWGIAAVSSLVGDQEWGVRLLAPLAHGAAAFCLFALGRLAFTPTVGAWAAGFYLLMPGVALSSVIMSTDAVLLPMWSAALLCLWRLRENPGPWTAVWLGLALGGAMLAKYAALYLLVGAALSALMDKPTRRALMSSSGLIAALVATMVLGPNLAWNAAHDFATVSHTADNASLSAVSPDLSHGLKFLIDQMAVFGPLSFICLAAGVFIRRSVGNKHAKSREIWLLCFIAPPLLVIAVQAIAVRAHANWAATAYPAASVLIASWIAYAPWKRWLKASLGINILIGGIIAALAVSPSIADVLNASGGLKRVRGWEETALQLQTLTADTDTTAIMFDEREVWHGVDYYGRTLELPPLRSWRRLDQARSHAEQAGAMRPGDDRNVLIASYREDFIPRISADFASITPAGELSVSLGGNEVRTLRLFRASGYAPLPRTADYEARFSDVDID